MSEKPTFVFDIETDGLFMVDRQSSPPEDAREATRVWLIGLTELGPDGRSLGARVFSDEPGLVVSGSIDRALQIMGQVGVLVSHNGLMYDLPVLRRLRGFVPDRDTLLRDTLVGSRWRYPERKNHDWPLWKRGALPSAMLGRHSLESWGYRLGVLKGDYGKSTDWSAADQAMVEYCRRDVEVTALLYEHLLSQARPPLPWSLDSWDLECRFARILGLQALHGVSMDLEKARNLAAHYEGQYRDLLEECRAMFPPFEDVRYTPKKRLRRVDVKPFKPTSSDHVARAFQEHYGWVPQEFTEKTGKPVVSDEVLESLPYHEAGRLAALRKAQRWRARLVSGKQAWLRNVRPDGTVPADVIHNSTVTHRCGHRIVSNVPKPKVVEAKECRSLFAARPGRVLVGCDASGLELRCLAHYVAHFDGGQYAAEVVAGDAHSRGMAATGVSDRDVYKRVFYGWLYGAGDARLGAIVGKNAAAGAALRNAIQTGIAGVDKLMAHLWRALSQRGQARHYQGRWYLNKDKAPAIRLPDGRWAELRSAHALLNTLLQGSGAVVMKQATVLADVGLRGTGYAVWDEELDPEEADCAQVIHYHDEIEYEARPECAEGVAAVLQESIAMAGDKLGMLCPMAGEAKIGANWGEVH